MNARWCRRLLSSVLPPAHRGIVLAHFDQECEERRARDGARAATRWYAVQAAASLPGAARLRVQSWRLGQTGRDVLQDARYALRQLHRARGFTLVATLMLAIGLGLVAGAYTVVNGLLIKGWDVPDNHQMFRAMASTRGVPEGARVEDGFSRGAFEHFRQHAATADYAAYLPENFRIPTRQGEPGHYVYALYVGDGFLDVLRIRLQRGPGFTASAEPQVILAHRAWRRIFGEDPEIIGRAIQLSGIPATVVGILEPGFDAMGERSVEALVNLQHARGGDPRETATQVAHEDSACCVWLAGRRRPGYSREQVQAELAVLTEQYRSAMGKPALEVNLRTTAPGLPSDRGVGLILALLGAGVSLVWCLTCANVGNLFLARSLRRDREIAVRLSLGATRGRLIRQLLTEGLVLAGIAASLAFVMTYSVPVIMERLDGMPASMFAPDVRVALIVALGTVLTCLVVALAPALQTTRVAWRGSGVAIASSSRGARDVVLAVQIAVAMVLVISAALITRGILRAATTQADFALHETTAVNFALPAGAADDWAVRLAFHDSLADVVRADSTLALADSAPVTVHAGLQTSLQPAGAAAQYSARLLMVSPSAFDLLEVPIVEGRAHADDPATLEAVINQSLARRLAPAGSAIGLDVRLHFNDRLYTIVGVARDAHLLHLGRVEPMVFVWPQALGRVVMLARTAPGLQERMTGFANQAYAGATVTLTPLTDAVWGTLRNAWVGAAAAGGLAVIALLLAIIGVFGVFSYLIEARRRDIGIRLALGASRHQVHVAIAQQCRRALFGGVAAGLALSLLAGQLLRGFLFGLSPLDVPSFAVAGAVLALAALAATALPVRRALRVDPAVTLRAD